jgi:hypothetical protein
MTQRPNLSLIRVKLSHAQSNCAVTNRSNRVERQIVGRSGVRAGGTERTEGWLIFPKELSTTEGADSPRRDADQSTAMTRSSLNCPIELCIIRLLAIAEGL